MKRIILITLVVCNFTRCDLTSRALVFIKLSFCDREPRILIRRPFLGERIYSWIIGRYDRAVRASNFRCPEFYTGSRYDSWQCGWKRWLALAPSRSVRYLIKSGRVRTYGVRARVESIEYLPGIDFGLIASAVEGANHVARYFILFFFLAGKITLIVIDAMLRTIVFFTQKWKIA